MSSIAIGKGAFALAFGGALLEAHRVSFSTLACARSYDCRH